MFVKKLAWLLPVLMIHNLPASAADNECQRLFNAGEFLQAKQRCPQLANQGDADAAFIMAQIHTGITQSDYPLAVQWLKRANELGHSEAAYNLAVAYQYGQGTEQDISQAVSLYQRLAQQDHPKAQRNLGILYSSGTGVPQEYQQAFELFSRSAITGLPGSQYNLGIMYLQGTGTSKNEQQALHWLSQAAEAGHSSAQLALGILLAEQDPKASFKWYQQAAKQNNPFALYNLAIIHWQGKRVPQDLQLAEHYAFQASQLGHEKSSQLLAVLNQPASAQTQPVQPTTSASTSADNRLRDYQWVMQQPKREYFAQLTQLKNQAEVDAYLEHYNLHGVVDYFPAKTKLGEVYLLIFRDGFNGVQSTQQAVQQQLPEALASAVWIRTFESLQNGMKR